MITATFSPAAIAIFPECFIFSGGVAAQAGYPSNACGFRLPFRWPRGSRSKNGSLLRPPVDGVLRLRMRSPVPFTEDGSRVFNQMYARALKAWGITDGIVDPSRDRMLPRTHQQGERIPSVFVHSEGRWRPFLVRRSGSGEAPEGKGSQATRRPPWGYQHRRNDRKSARCTS